MSKEKILIALFEQYLDNTKDTTEAIKKAFEKMEACSDDDFNLYSDAFSDARFDGFTAGFQTALNLLMGGGN